MTTLQMDFALKVELDENLANRAEYHALLEGTEFGHWLESVIHRRLSGEGGVGPWLEAVLEAELNED